MQIVIFVILVMGPVFGTIAKKAKTHADQKRLEMERNKRRVQALRTGQPFEQLEREEQQSAESMRRAKLEELQRRRQEQIEELRRRHREAQARAAAQQAPMQGAQVRTSGRPQAPISAPVPARPPAPPQPRPQPVARSAQPMGSPRQTRTAADAAKQRELERRRAELRARREQYERAKAQAERARAAPVRERPPAAPQRAAAPRVKAPVQAAGSASLRSVMNDPDAIRRAIIMNELLSPPMALREPPGMV